VWDHVRARVGDNWEQPAGAEDDHLHFMVVCMEAWLIADSDSLAKFFGQSFKPGRLPQTNDLETVPKADVIAGLRAATRDTTKRAYAKGKGSFMALGAVDVNVVRARMSYCERFIQRLQA
jgi:hypothetical protein